MISCELRVGLSLVGSSRVCFPRQSGRSPASRWGRGSRRVVLCAMPYAAVADRVRQVASAVSRAWSMRWL